MTPAQREAQARNRYLVMGLSRIVGVAIAILGMLVLSERFGGVPPALGIALVLAGMLAIALVPRALARKWRTPPEA